MLKKVFKRIVKSVLGWQVRRLRRKHSFDLIAVAGSIGKTSTKFAVATVLKQKFRVRFQVGNYNDPVTVPLIFFDLPEPKLFNPLSWLVTFLKIELQLRRPYPYDIVIVELGTDGPGQLAQFSSYIDAEAGILTAIRPEHMEFFHDMDNVAAEELSLGRFCKKLFANADLCDEAYLSRLDTSPVTYAIDKSADYRLLAEGQEEKDVSVSVLHNGATIAETKVETVAVLRLYSLCAAASVGHAFGVAKEDIDIGLSEIQPVYGRMNILQGANGATIIDDTYNSSPEAVKRALDTLYEQSAPQKIALLGNMNELGEYAKEAHIEVGEYCDPKEIDMLVTIGKDASQYLAEAAKKRGCKVKTFNDPHQAGLYIKDVLRPKAIVLAKGSQNGVYAEEAVKQFLANKKDSSKLVRQTPDWILKKTKSFQKVS